MKQYFIDSNDQQILTIFKAKVTQNLTGRSVTGGPIPPTPQPTTTSMVTVKCKALHLLQSSDWFCTEKLIQWYPTLDTPLSV